MKPNDEQKYQCRHCACQITPTEKQIAKRNFICRFCTSNYMKAWRQRRKAAGLPHQNKPASNEWRRAYEKTRLKEPEYRENRNAKMREYRANPALALRHSARRKLRDAVKSGFVIKTACFICGESKVEAHHSDYSAPLCVIWLCKEHHLAAHMIAKDSSAEKGGAT